VLAAARFVHVSSAPYALNLLKDEQVAISSGGVSPLSPPSTPISVSSSAVIPAGKKPGDLVYFPDSSSPQAAQEWRESFAQEMQMAYASYLETVRDRGREKERERGREREEGETGREKRG
jgi:hypothetical protein